MKNKILAMLLALCMVMSLLPLTVFAAGAEGGTRCKTCGCTITEAPAEGDDDSDADVTDDDSDGDADSGQTPAMLSDDDADADDEASASIYCTAEVCGCANRKYASDVCGHEDVCTVCYTQVVPCDHTETVGEAEAATEYACQLKKNHGGDHKYTCVSEGCDNLTTTAGGKCDACAAAEKNSDGYYNCGSQNYPNGSSRCAADEHEDLCPRKCPTVGCSLTVGHTADSGKHNNDTCNGNETSKGKCGATEHIAGCADYTKPAAENGKDNAIVDVTVKVPVDCDCTLDHDKNGKHDGIAIADEPCVNADGGAEVSITVAVLVTWDVELDKDEEVDTVKTAANKTAAIAEAKAAIQDAIDEPAAAPEADDDDDDDAGFDPAAALSAIAAKTPEKNYCAACAAFMAADAVKECTMAVTCTSPVHNADCLALCNHEAGCPNTKGNPDAHSVRYQVWARYERKTVADDVTTVEKSSGATPVEGVVAYDTLAEAKAYITSVTGDASKTSKTEDLGEGVTETTYYSVMAIHCPRAGVVDSTVIAEDGTESAPSEEPAPVVPVEAADFADVKGTEWYAGELTTLVKMGIFKGILDTEKNEYNFEPKTEMTTESLVALIARVMGEDVQDGEGSAWAQPYVDWAAKKGLTEGVDLGKITRGDTALLLWRAVGSPESEQSLEKFADADSLEGDQLAAMKWAVEVGIFMGSDDGKLNAGNILIREQQIAVIARFVGVVNK